MQSTLKITQYMATTPDKFGLKFWLAVEVENKHLSNVFPHVSVPTDFVLKLMGSSF